MSIEALELERDMHEQQPVLYVVPAALRPNEWQEASRAEAETDPVRWYLDEITKYPLLTHEEEIELSKAVRAGIAARNILEGEPEKKTAALEIISEETRQTKINEPTEKITTVNLKHLEATGLEAKEKMVNSNLRLVVSIAKHYDVPGMPLLDLIQEGNMGLMHAVDKYDYRKGWKFSTYATYWIRQAIGYAIANKARLIRIPHGKVITINKILGTYARLSRQLGEDPDFRKLAEESGLSVAEVEEHLAYNAIEPASFEDKRTTDIDDSVTFGDEVKETEYLTPENIVFRSIGQTAVQRILEQTLSPEEIIVVDLISGMSDEPVSVRVAAKRLKIKYPEVQKIYDEAIDKLREADKLQDLMDLLT